MQQVRSRAHALRLVLALAPLTLSATGLLAQDSTTVTGAPADSVPKKKKGLFGKLKEVAADKTVQSVAKVAACTMVPGGQYVAGAIDAASSKSAGQATSTAASAASGSNCYGGGVMNAAAGGAAPGMTNVVAGGLNGGAGLARMTGMSMPMMNGLDLARMPKDQKKQAVQVYRQLFAQMGTPKDKQDRFLALLEQAMDGKGDPAALEQAFADAVPISTVPEEGTEP